MFSIVALFSFINFMNSFIGSRIYGNRIASKLAMRVEAFFSEELLRKIQAIDAVKYDDPVFYDKLQKASAEVENRAMTVLNQVLSLFRCIANLLLGVGLLATLSPFFIVLAIAVGIAQYFLDLNFIKQKFNYSEEITPIIRRTEYYKSLFYQKATMTDVKQYPSFGVLLFGRFKESLYSKHQLMQSIEQKRLILSYKVSAIVTLTGTFIPYAYMGYVALIGLITIADTTVLINAYKLVTDNMTDFSHAFIQLKESALYINNLKDVLNYQPNIENQTSGQELVEIESIEFSNVSFRYPCSSKNALSDICFHIKRGQKVAIVGINGSGKTTLVKLLTRLYDPDSGAIYINGQDIKSYSIQSLRNAITSTFQEFQSYSLPISEMISCASGDDIDTERVYRVLKQVGLYDAISEYPDGINTEYSKMFNENGIVFSGGQLQKLMLARMLYKNSNVLIMDEPSASLDPESEYEINREISSISTGKTVFMISHRLSTTRDADSILLLENGTIIETGTHQQLIAKKGRYAHLFAIQSSGYYDEA